MSHCIHCSSEQTGRDRNQVIRSPGLSSSLTSTNKAPLTFSDFLKPPHQLGTKRSDTGQTQESMGTLDTQCGPNRLIYHVSICSEMEVQHLLNFSSSGFLHCCCHLQKLPWCVRTCLLPCSFRYINLGMPAKAHGHVLKVGSAVMSRRSVVRSRSPEWAHMKSLQADRIFCQHFKDLPAPTPPGITVFRLIKVHLQVFCA